MTVAPAPHCPGHRLGGFVPRLGDGRALLLGEVVGVDGQLRNGQLRNPHQHAVERLAG